MPGASWTDAGVQKSHQGVGGWPSRQADETGSRRMKRGRRNCSTRRGGNMMTDTKMSVLVRIHAIPRG
jgi:hypothetical protein